MSQRITVLKNPVVTAQSKAGKPYSICELGYKDKDGKVKGMRIFGLGEMKAVYDVARAAKVGDVLEAEFQQNDKGYWEFRSLENTGTKEATPSDESTRAASTPSRGNWETAEERAHKQVIITRQACLNTTIAYFELVKAKPSLEEVIKTAAFFENNYILAPQLDKQAKEQVPSVE